MLRALNASNQLARYNRVSSCGERAYVYRKYETGEIRIKASYCHDKLCLPCAAARARTIADNIQAKMQDRQQHYYHVALTIKHSDKPLADQLDALNRYWKKLRDSKAWKASVTGGFSTVEVTRNKRGEWHPHMHLIVEAKGSLDANAIASKWEQITGATETHISPVDGVNRAAYILSRYVSKSLSATVYNDEQALVEYTLATTGRKTVSTFGTWHGLGLTTPDRDPIDADSWHCLGSLGTVLARSRWDRPLRHIGRQLEAMRTVLVRPPPRPPAGQNPLF